VQPDSPAASLRDFCSGAYTNSSSETGRPLTGHYRGKRSDPEWANITILMRRSIKRDVRRRLEDEGEGMDLSELVDHLLTDWLSKSSG
jgi:hypothetical protein